MTTGHQWIAAFAFALALGSMTMPATAVQMDGDCTCTEDRDQCNPEEFVNQLARLQPHIHINTWGNGGKPKRTG